MKLVINKDRSVIPIGTWGTKNENDYEILEFEFPEELENYNKRIVYYLDDTKPWDAIVDNKAYITNAITSKENVKAYIWCTKENSERPADTDFRSQEFEMHFYENENADGIVPTPVQVDGFNTMLTAMNAKIDEVDALETTIETAEAERQEAEATRVSNESTRESNESTRQTNEETRQSQEADRERRTDEAIADIQDKTAEYNANAEAKTNAFNQNATQKTNDFNLNYTQKVNDFNTNATTQKTDFNTNASSKTSAFNSNAETKTNAFNTNATSKTNAFNSNATEKTTAFNDNASTKTSEFNTNAESKTSAFNENATQKTTNFDNNAAEKTDEFNTNAQNKIDEYDEHIVEYQAQIDELQEEVEELSENMPWNTTEQATEISVDDAAKYSRNKLELFGNTYQLSLPSGYTHLEYIESTDYGHNRNYINTGIYPNNDTKIEMDFLLREQSGHSYDRLFGATDTLFSTQLSNFVPNDYRMHNKYNNIDKDFILNYSTKYNLKREKNKIYINDELKSEFEESVFQDTNELRLFSSVTSDRDGKFVLYFCKIWDNNTLVRDFVPCKNSNNEVGLYDFVSQTFFGNSGTRDFVAGNEVTIPNPNFPQDIHVVTGENTIGVQGKNLLPGEVYEHCTITSDGKKISDNTRACSNFIAIDETQTYFFSANMNFGFFGIAQYDINYNFISRQTWQAISSHILTNFPSGTKYIKFFAQVQQQPATQNQFARFNTQIEKGSTATSYVPYYHADYPIDLRGKNKFDVTKIIPNTYIGNDGKIGTSTVTNLSDYIYVQRNKEYTLSYKCDNFENPSNRSLVFYTSNKEYISGGIYNPANKLFTFTPEQDGYIRFGYDINCYDIQIEEGDTATTYTAYNPLELCKIEQNATSSIQDYYFKEDSNWYEYKAINKKTINNVKNWAIQSNSKQREKTRVFEHNFVDKAVGRVISNNFKNKGVVLTTTDDEEYIGDGAGYNQRVYISIKKDRLVGYDDSMTDSQANQLFQTWLSNSNTLLYYIKATPTVTQITDETLISQLDATYEHLKLVKGTNITVTAEDLAPYMQLSYMQDLPSKLDNLDSRLALLE